MLCKVQVLLAGERLLKDADPACSGLCSSATDLLKIWRMCVRGLVSKMDRKYRLLPAHSVNRRIADGENQTSPCGG